MKLRHAMIAFSATLAALGTTNLRGAEMANAYFANEEASLEAVSFEKIASDTQAISGCRPCYRQGGLVFGVEGTFLAPISDGAGQSFGMTSFVSGDVETFSTDDRGIDGLVPAPRIWFGYAGPSGWGMQVRYWELNTSAGHADPFLPFTVPPILSGDTIGYGSNSSLEMQALDLELTRDFQAGCWDLLGTFGYRHALRDYQESIGVQGVLQRPVGLGGGADFVIGTSSGLSTFEGDGLTFSLSGTRPSSHGFEWFWSTRGSVLWGDGQAMSQTQAHLSGPAGTAFETTGALASGGDTLWIGEFQAGTQWSHQLACSPARFFARAAFEYQYWGGLDAGATSFATAGELNVGQLTVAAGAPGDSIDLVGFAFATGIVW